MIIDIVAAILALTVLLSRPQIDLEPEGKVFVVIDLTGSSSEGRKSALHSSLSSFSYRHTASSDALSSQRHLVTNVAALVSESNKRHGGSD